MSELSERPGTFSGQAAGRLADGGGAARNVTEMTQVGEAAHARCACGRTIRTVEVREVLASLA